MTLYTDGVTKYSPTKKHTLMLIASLVVFLFGLGSFFSMYDFGGIKSQVNTFIINLGGGQAEMQELSDIEGSPFEEPAEKLYFKPIRLYSDQLDFRLEVETITTDENGTLGVPAKWENAGWYKRSAKPGEDGNMIIDGHYDNNYGNPAAFWQLKNAKVNDTVAVVDDIGRSFNYKITEIFYVDIQDPNRLNVLAGSEEATITLLTCGGVWLPSEGTYNKRLVVKGVLVD